MSFAEMQDPTRPPIFSLTEQTSLPSSFTLMAVFIHAHKRVAVIGNKAVQEGERIGEYNVIAITPYTVELEGPMHEKRVLPLVEMVKQQR